jgi:hypothetical protein
MGASSFALVDIYEDGMTKKLTGKETKVTQNPKKPVAAELQDDELQQVTG